MAQLYSSCNTEEATGYQGILSREDSMASLSSSINSVNSLAANCHLSLGEPSSAASFNNAVETSNTPTGDRPVPSYISDHYCQLHKSVRRLYCDRCKLAVCTQCVSSFHADHFHCVRSLRVEESVEEHANVLSSEISSNTRRIQEAIDCVDKMRSSVDTKAAHTAKEVNCLIKRYMEALKVRELELITKIEEIRQQKTNAFLDHIEKLRSVATRLSRNSDNLHTSSLSGNRSDMVSAIEEALKTLNHMEQNCHIFKPRLDSNIMHFVAPDDALFLSVSKMGAITSFGSRFPPIRNPNISSSSIGSPSAGSPSTQSPINGSTEGSPQECLGAMGIGRPIFGAMHPVIAKNALYPLLDFGSDGGADGELCRPWGICCNKSGRLFITDCSNNRIQVFALNGTFLFNIGSHGTAPGQFNRPVGIAIDVQDRVIVADKDNHRIQVFNTDGTFLFMFGKHGSKNGEFKYPWDVAVNAFCQIVVTDTRNKRVQMFNSDGTYINKFVEKQQGVFDSPRGICFTPAGSILVTDFYGHRIAIIDHNMVKVQYLGSLGTRQAQFRRPQGIICDDEGRIVVIDTRNTRVQVLESNGKFLWSFGNNKGSEFDEMNTPTSLCLSPDGNIIVVDCGNNRVQIY